MGELSDRFAENRERDAAARDANEKRTDRRRSAARLPSTRARGRSMSCSRTRCRSSLPTSCGPHMSTGARATTLRTCGLWAGWPLTRTGGPAPFPRWMWTPKGGGRTASCWEHAVDACGQQPAYYKDFKPVDVSKLRHLDFVDSDVAALYVADDGDVLIASMIEIEFYPTVSKSRLADSLLWGLEEHQKAYGSA